MSLTLRSGTPEDAPRCGTICYEAFKAIAEQRNFPPDFPSPEAATARLAPRLAHPGHYVVVAELDGRIVGALFLDERGPIVGLGPITVDPTVQNRGIGRQLMHHALERVAKQASPGVRLVQPTYHGRSLSLYASLGFEVRESLACMQGPPLRLEIPGFTVRSAPVQRILRPAIRSVDAYTGMIVAGKCARRWCKAPPWSSSGVASSLAMRPSLGLEGMRWDKPQMRLKPCWEQHRGSWARGCSSLPATGSCFVGVWRMACV
jgi:predicted N-acetyltransferase YhbS